MHPLNCLPYLRAFDTVVQHGSIRRAAEELGLTPGAVSLQMKRLSEVAQIPLFEKSGRGIRLTPAGSDFARVVRKNLSGISMGLQDATRLSDAQPDRSLRFSIPPALGVSWLAGAIVNYCANSGRQEVYVETRENLSGVDWNTTDLAVVWGKPPFPGCWWKLLADVEARPVCSPRLLARLRIDQGIRSLKGMSLLHEDDGDTWARWAAGANVSLDETLNVHFPSPSLAQSAAVQGQGLALISNLLAAGDIRDGRLVHLYRSSISRSRGYYFVCPEERADLPLIQSVVISWSSYLEISTGS